MDGMGAVRRRDFMFECPQVFETAKEVELEDGLFVTCDELKPYYDRDLPPVYLTGA